MVTVSVTQGDIATADVDAIVVNLFEGVTAPGGGTGAVDRALDGGISAVIADGEIWLFSGAIIERDLGHLSPAIRAKALRETVAKLYGKEIPAPMPASTAPDPSLEAWRQERAGHYAGIS